MLDLLQEVEQDVLHLVDNEGKFIIKGPQVWVILLSSTAEISGIANVKFLISQTSCFDKIYIPLNIYGERGD